MRLDHPTSPSRCPSPSPSSGSPSRAVLQLKTNITPAVPSVDAPNRPPYRFRRATDSALRRADKNGPPHISQPRSPLSSRRYLTNTNLGHSSQQSYLASIISYLWIPAPASLLRRPNLIGNPHHYRSSYLSRLWEICIHARFGLSKPILWLILLLIVLGAIDLWRGCERTLDNQDWGPTRFRVGHRTGAETRRLQKQMRLTPFITLAGLGIPSDPVYSSETDPLGLAGRWLRPLELSQFPLVTRAHIQPDVSAVILNWSRPENVIVIVAHLCQYDFFESIIIWNNNLKLVLSFKDFENTKCPQHKLLIYNSPSNNYFFSRFLACLQSPSKYCYFQDDDCIVKPIRTMYTQFKALLPRPSSVVVQADPVYSVMYNWEWCFNDPPNRLHACFAWLGHGSFVTKSAVSDFVSLLSKQSMPSDSVALADNFFTTSLNRKAHVIVAPAIIGLPLSDRGFSDGTAGLERNRVYIQRGVELLSKILKAGNPLGVSPEIDEAGSHVGAIRAADQADRLFLMTNIEAFPPGGGPRFEGFDHGLAAWEDQLGTTGYSLGHLRGRALASAGRGDWVVRERRAIRHSYAAAIDGDNSTFWSSPEPVKRNDWVGLGWIDWPIIGDSPRKILEVHFIVSNPDIFQQDTVVEQLQADRQAGPSFSSSSSARWERLKARDGVLALDGRLAEDRIQCVPLDPAPTQVQNHDPQKFDCFIKFLDPHSLVNSLAIRVRSQVDHQLWEQDQLLDRMRWWVWEVFVLAL